MLPGTRIKFVPKVPMPEGCRISAVDPCDDRKLYDGDEGTVIEIVNVNMSLVSGIYVIMDRFSFSVMNIAKDWIKEVPKKKLCTCQLQLILFKGCQCGGL